MNEIIVDSIRKGRRLRFIYHGKARVVEPQCYGIGAVVLHGYALACALTKCHRC
jgi:hypothetical protein